MLTMEPVVTINLTLGSVAATTDTFSTGAIVGPSTVLKTAGVRYKNYTSLEGVAADFATTDPEYVAASKYFGVTPTPKQLAICYFDHAATTPESPEDGVKAAVEAGMDFYGLYMCPKADASASDISTQIVALIAYLGTTRKRGVLFYGVTGTASAATTAGALMPTIAAYTDRKTSMRAFGLLCDTDATDAAGAMGLAMGYASQFEYNAFALAYKEVATASPKNITDTDVTLVKGVNGNVYIRRTKAYKCLEPGTTGSGLRFDDVLYLDRIMSNVQNACFNILVGNETKLPQNDSTTSMFVSAINRELENYYNGGVLTDAPWRGNPIGNVNTGDIVDHGYAVYAESFTEQTDADRAARKAMPITILLQLSGAIESVVLNMYVQE